MPHSTDTQHVERVQADPATLLVDRNVRADVRLDKQFIASLRTHGVLQPIVAVRTADDALRVRHGHRRTLGAIQAGLTAVPVDVIGDEATDDEATIDRLTTQYAENQHRHALTTAEQVGVFEQLAALGVPAAKIARQTSAPRGHVDAALTVARSAAARQALGSHHLTLDQAALLAEFDGDEDATARLLDGIARGTETHVAQRLRDDQAAAARVAAYATRLRETGVTVVERPEYGDRTKPLHRLLTEHGEPLTADSHADCPGHAAYVGTEWGYHDPASGEPVDDPATDHSDEDDTENSDDTEDADDDSDPQAVPGTGQDRRAVWGQRLTTVYVCTSPAEHGHRDAWGGHDSGTPRRSAAEMTPEHREAARTERRDVIESNKAWTAAETVRRDWLRIFLSRKTPPKGSARFTATAVALDADIIASIGGNHLGADLLNCPPAAYGRNNALADLIATASDSRAHVLTLALVLAAYEDHTDRNDWRTPRPPTRRYLTFLSEHGYPLADVERRACGYDPDSAPANA